MNDVHGKNLDERADAHLDDEVPDGAEVLGLILAMLKTFLVYPSEHAATAHVLWIAHTHAMNAWESTPRIAFLSPEPESGKTRALEISELLVPNPLDTVNASAAYLYRSTAGENGPPTLLLDEADTVFDLKAKQHEDTRGFVNAGHRRTGKYRRCAVRGKEIVPEEYSAWCAVALAGLGMLPQTILSRSIVIHMRRRAPDEIVQPYRHRLHKLAGYGLRDLLAKWASSLGDAIQLPDSMPQGVEDRQADCWEPLIAMADAAGGSWPALARAAAVALVQESRESSASLGVRLLADVRTAFADHDAMLTAELLAALNAMDESPWGDMKGRELGDRVLARMLKQYQIKSRSVRSSISGKAAKGYRREDLHDSWARYLPPVGDQS